MMFKWAVWLPHILWGGLFLYLYNHKGAWKLDYDTMSATMTSLQLVIVVGGILGFGYFAYISEKKAAEVARQVAKDEAVPEARRATEEWLARFAPSEAQAETFKNAFDDGLVSRALAEKQGGEQ